MVSSRKDRKFFRFLMGVLMVLPLGFPLARAGVYNINFTITSSFPSGNPSQTDSVIGTITTDGTIGVLAQADILSWNLELIDGLNSANDLDITPDNSYIYFEGDGLTATATGLFFDLGSPDALFAIANGGNSGYNYFCFNNDTNECYDGVSIAPNYFFTDGVCTDSTACGDAANMNATLPLYTTSNAPSSAPEPSTFEMMLGAALVFASCGLIRRGRDRGTSVSAARRAI